jgi:hypothetical protein
MKAMQSQRSVMMIYVIIGAREINDNQHEKNEMPPSGDGTAATRRNEAQ